MNTPDIILFVLIYPTSEFMVMHNNETRRSNAVAPPVSKKDLVRTLEEIGTLLDLKGENPFKSRAYFAAARSIEATDEDLSYLIESGQLASLKGIGKALNEKITELVTTGALEYYNTLKASIPQGLVEMLKIQGLGPKKIKILHDKLQITTIGELEYACIENHLIEIPGFGRKTQENILKGIQHYKKYSQRHLYADVIREADNILEKLSQHAAVTHSCIAGSLRRCRETVKDIDILVATDNSANIADWFEALPQVERVTGRGDTKVSVILTSGINCDLRIVRKAEYPHALQHFTGSSEHNTALRSLAKNAGLKMNEYGLFQSHGCIPCKSETEIYQALGLAYIPPELRENRGEIAAAATGNLPDLVTCSDIRGLLHIHTNDSDGVDSIESLAAAARKMGMEYIGITDHSKTAFYAGGLSWDEVMRQHEHIDLINERDPSLHIFKGIEVEILPDGSLDYADHLLRSFDFIIAAVHSHFGMTEEAMTDRIIKALDNPFPTILAHPTGRLLLAREPYSVNLPHIIDFAARKGKFLELNANPYRLDLDWRFCRHAKKLGVKIAINPDAHSIAGLYDINFGINIARKGWLSASDCINCLGLKEIKKLFSKPI